MGYTIRICRPDDDINIEEWKNAVAEVPDIKIDSSDFEAVTCDGESEITISGSDGDVSVLFTTGGFLGFGKKSHWEKVISYNGSDGSFNYTDDLESPKSPVRQAAKRLAERLNAKIIGDEDVEFNW